jgi:hypothetical protein
VEGFTRAEDDVALALLRQPNRALEVEVRQTVPHVRTRGGHGHSVAHAVQRPRFEVMGTLSGASIGAFDGLTLVRFPSSQP